MEQFEKAANEIVKQEELNRFGDNITKYNMKTVIWGVGDCGHRVYDVLTEQNIRIDFFADNCYSGSEDRITGVRMIDTDNIFQEKEKYNILVSVVNDDAYHAIYRQLINGGVRESQIWNMGRYIERLTVGFFHKNCDRYKAVYNMLGDSISKKVYLERMKRVYLLNDLAGIASPVEEEYFDKINVISENEVFVDCGGFDGRTSQRFIERCNGKYKKIIIFEPEICKRELIEQNMGGEKYLLYPYGVWSEEKKLYFEARGDVASHITKQKSDYVIQVVTLDQYIYHEAPTLIKMDIEGAEQEALVGARKTIQTYRPKLVICLYHKPEDLFEIPLYIKSLNSDYNLYIRQYSNTKYETVCYAV